MTQPKPKSWQQQPICDNFEHIEQPIGKVVRPGRITVKGKTKDQVDGNAPVEETKQTISEINTVLDKAERVC